MTPYHVLNEYFGHDSFRGKQEAVIERVLSGRHALVIMPTGMGKSVCYQIPAILWSKCHSGNALTVNGFSRADGTFQNGALHNVSATDPLRPLTLVISPLIALMKDQVDSLQRREVSATYINSSLLRDEREARYRSVADGQFDLLYVTPERFRKPEFVEVIGKRCVKLVAVDEAHCISEWGHDFRPDYTRLREFRQMLGNPTTIALTATATPDVQTDIVRQLGLREEDIALFHEGIDRPNLHLDVAEVWGDEEKLHHIQNVRQSHPGAGIVYFTLIKTLQNFSECLRESSIAHLVYHGGLERTDRKRLQERFMTEPDHLVLATNAFGMGIDKENIRFVLHADVPGSMESYYQEIGRAGRDGLESLCLLLYDQRDLATQMEFLKWSNPGVEFYGRVHDLLLHDLEKIRAFGCDWLRERLHHRDKHDHRLETALAMLDRFGVTEGGWDLPEFSVARELPEALRDQARLDEKLRRDQQKLYTLVQYAKCEGDRKAFIHAYFGLI